jgi:hypothetical protein
MVTIPVIFDAVPEPIQQQIYGLGDLAGGNVGAD